jgi:hypothetical protein
MTGPLFPLGGVYATPGALALAERGIDLGALLARHAAGDWGDVDAADRAANGRALIVGARLLSSYRTPAGKLWIISEGDRSATTALLPDEY